MDVAEVLGPDPSLTVLDVADAAHLRVLVRTWFAEHGIEVTTHPQHVETDDGVQYGLWNLAVLVNDAPGGFTQWPALIDAHFTSIVGAQRVTPADLSDEDFRSMLRLQLIREELVPTDPVSGYDYAPLWAPGLRQVLVLDLADIVVTVSRRDVEQRGSFEEMWALGRAQTAALVGTEALERQWVNREGRGFWWVAGDSFFTASMAMDLPALVRRFEPDANLDQGVLFSVPLRNQVNFRVIDSGLAALDGLMTIPEYTAIGFSQGGGPLSGSTYLWLGGEITQVSEFTGTSINVTPGPYLEPLLNEGAEES